MVERNRLLMSPEDDFAYGQGISPDATWRNLLPFAEFGLGMSPGSGEAMSARDAWDASGRGGNALLRGNYGDAASEYLNMGTGLLGAIPGIGMVARGTKRGAAWMDRNLPGGFNRLLDAVYPSDPRSTTSIFAGPTAKTAEDFDTRSVLLPHRHFDDEHLVKVKGEMEKLGSPEIRGFPDGDNFIAIEGSHRLRAAEELGVPVRFKSIEDETHINLDDIGLDDNWWFNGERNIPIQEFRDWYLQNFVPWQPEFKKVKVTR